MMTIDFQALMIVSVIYAAGLLSPGPNFLIVVRQALQSGRGMALVTVAGVVTVNAIWASSSLFGLSVILHLFPWIFLGLKVLGAAYLIWSGVRLWWEARQPVVAQTGARRSSNWLDAFRIGLSTNLSNVKAILFYSSIFSAAAPSPEKTLTLLAALAIVLVLAFCWYSTMAILFSGQRIGALYKRFKAVIDRVCGSILIAFGIRIATDI